MKSLMLFLILSVGAFAEYRTNKLNTLKVLPGAEIIFERYELKKIIKNECTRGVVVPSETFKEFSKFMQHKPACVIISDYVAPPPPPPPPPVVAPLSTGTHCDIGGPWGWRSQDSVCPVGTNPIAPGTNGIICPAGWAQFNNGCYISNSDPRRQMSGCATSDPADECCVYLCDASAPPLSWTCIPWDTGGFESSVTECRCTNNFGGTKMVQYYPGSMGTCTKWGTDPWGDPMCTAWGPPTPPSCATP
ncbi:hypothetical protein [Bdellovibrio sp. HCB-110]|uniref:hypothetical protein n=1 Tax=Bdellovibrio sp. HCB-110 TaxID=3391182 RepID=UPI0039B38A93